MARVLLVGYDPDTVDYSNPALPPGMSAEKIRAGIAVTLKQMTDRGVRPLNVAGALSVAVVHRGHRRRLCRQGQRRAKSWRMCITRTSPAAGRQRNADVGQGAADRGEYRQAAGAATSLGGRLRLPLPAPAEQT